MLCSLTVSPSIVIVPESSGLVAEGNTALLSCTAYGVPLPSSVVWYQGDELLFNDSRISIYSEQVVEGGLEYVLSILEICSVDVADAGSYSCFVENVVGNDTASFELDVGMCIYLLHSCRCLTDYRLISIHVYVTLCYTVVVVCVCECGDKDYLCLLQHLQKY